MKYLKFLGIITLNAVTCAILRHFFAPSFFVSAEFDMLSCYTGWMLALHWDDNIRGKA